MAIFTSYQGKLIQMNKPYPIYDREDDNKIIGYTEVGDLAVITYCDSNYTRGYFETVIVSGKYIGVDTLALNKADIKNSTFIFNTIDNYTNVRIGNTKVKFENR